MGTKSFKIEGELILVEPILVKQSAIDAEGVFKGVVKILQFGERTDSDGYEVGGKVLIRQNCIYSCPYTKESYIYREQILRTV
jgi:hypothetical protein